jgi:hypothetical protein
MKRPRVGFKAIDTALLILTIEPLLFSINALAKSLLIPTETQVLRWFGYRDLPVKIIYSVKLGANNEPEKFHAFNQIKRSYSKNITWPFKYL